MAASLASGTSAHKAFVAAYPAAHPTPKTTRNLAGRKARAKPVQAELDRLLADPMLQPVVLIACPESRDPEKLRAHAVSTMVRLTHYSDPQVCYHAAAWLAQYATSLEEAQRAERKPGAAASDRASVLAELRGLYRKALNTSPLIEAVAEPAAPPAQAEPAPQAEPEPAAE